MLIYFSLCISVVDRMKRMIAIPREYAASVAIVSRMQPSELEMHYIPPE